VNRQRAEYSNTSDVPQRTNLIASHLQLHVRAGLQCVLDSACGRVKYSGGARQGARGMAIDDATLDPEIADLVRSAFDKSWQFVKTDPQLAHADMDEIRTRLSNRLTRLASNGERDLLRLANGAIGELRREGRASGFLGLP
jgi:hypothetical protein